MLDSMEGAKMVQEKSVSARAREQANYIIDVTDACIKRGIENPYQLWQKIGGSKATASQLFSGTSEMIRTDTMNRLHKTLGITPAEYIFNRFD